MADTLYDKILKSIKNHKFLAVLISIGVIIISVSQFFTSFNDLIELFRKKGVKVVDVRIISEPKELETFKEEWGEININQRFLNRILEGVLASGELDSAMLIFNKDSALIKEGHLSTGGFPVLDIKLLNESNNTVYFKEIQIKSEIVSYDTTSGFNCSPVAPSFNFNILLNANKSKDIVTRSISQAIEPNQADRLIIIIGQNSPREHIYELIPSLIDQNNYQIDLGNFLVKMPGYCELGTQIGLRSKKK